LDYRSVEGMWGKGTGGNKQMGSPPPFNQLLDSRDLVELGDIKKKKFEKNFPR
jgi:hypothetical protein